MKAAELAEPLYRRRQEGNDGRAGHGAEWAIQLPDERLRRVFLTGTLGEVGQHAEENALVRPRAAEPEATDVEGVPDLGHRHQHLFDLLLDVQFAVSASSSAASAGVSVSGLKAEIAIEKAMVKANCW